MKIKKTDFKSVSYTKRLFNKEVEIFINEINEMKNQTYLTFQQKPFYTPVIIMIPAATSMKLNFPHLQYAFINC